MHRRSHQTRQKVAEFLKIEFEISDNNLRYDLKSKANLENRSQRFVEGLRMEFLKGFQRKFQLCSSPRFISVKNLIRLCNPIA